MMQREKPWNYPSWLRFLYFVTLVPMMVLSWWVGLVASCHSISSGATEWNAVERAPAVVGAASLLWLPPALIGAFLFTLMTAAVERRAWKVALSLGIWLVFPAVLCLAVAFGAPCITLFNP